jgi:hypothetical protein
VRVLLLTLICTYVQADKLEDAAQLLVDRGLEAWAKGDLPAARASFASARDLLPEKPNPYRLLALADQKLGRCDDALKEADRFLALAAASDPRRAEVQSLREGCVRPHPSQARPPKDQPARVEALQPTQAQPPAKKPTNVWRNSAIASLVIGAAGVIAGVPLLIFVDNKAAGAVPTAVGAAGLLLTIPFFVVDFEVR